MDEHLARLLAAAAPLPPRRLSLTDAHGCRLAEDVRATAPLPGFDNSAMDGYAVRVADVAGAPVELPVVADVPAGAPADFTLPPGGAARIMTGARLPAGTEAVVPVEDTDGGTDTVLIRVPAADGRHLRRTGALDEKGAPTRVQRQAPVKKDRVGPAQYLREVRDEMRKVAWPKRPEVVRYSIVVIVTVIVYTALVGGLDYLFGLFSGGCTDERAQRAPATW